MSFYGNLNNETNHTYEVYRTRYKTNTTHPHTSSWFWGSCPGVHM